MGTEEAKAPQWTGGFAEEDWQFVKRFLLASGSLKDLAAEYGVSYPTIRLRLDRLIEKVKAFDTKRPKTPLHRQIQALVAEGKLDLGTARALIKAFEQSIRTDEEA